MSLSKSGDKNVSILTLRCNEKKLKLGINLSVEQTMCHGFELKSFGKESKGKDICIGHIFLSSGH